MREAEEFTEWLASAAQSHWRHRDQLEQPVMVVGVVAKSSRTGEPGGKLIEKLVENAVFCGSYEKNLGGSIEVYYSPYHQIVFLYLKSYHDGQLQPKLFTENKRFFEVLQEVEHLFIKYLFAIFILSHVVIFIQPDTRIDSVLIRNLISVNEIRAQVRSKYTKSLVAASGLPTIWADEGRLALPRILFLMHENRVKRGSVLRPGQNFPDYNIMVDRLERSREFQIVHLLRSQSLTAEHLGIALASLSPHRIPFVHIVDPSETETQVIEECLLNLCKGVIDTTACSELIDQNMSSLIKTEQRLSSVDFFRRHVKDIMNRESKQSFFFLIPMLKEFVEGAGVLMQVTRDSSVIKEDKMIRWLSEEKLFENDLISQYFRAATDLYCTLLNDRKPLSKFMQNIDVSGAKHIKAIKYVGAFLRLTLSSSQLETIWPAVVRRCQLIFKGSTNQCYTRSITDSKCKLLAHKVRGCYVAGKSMSEGLKGRCFNHFSGFSHLSTCSCGRTQKLRNDPFNVKEANYDFYQQFECCKKLENMPFRLYNPGIKWDVNTTETKVVRKGDQPKPRGLKVMSRREDSSFSTEDSRSVSEYTINRPKSRAQVLNELTWQYNKMCHDHSDKYLKSMWYTVIKENIDKENVIGSDGMDSEDEEMGENEGRIERKKEKAEMKEQKIEMKGQKVELKGQKMKFQVEKNGVGDQKMKFHDQKLQNHIQKSAVNGQKSAENGQKPTENGQKPKENQKELLPLYSSWSVVCLGPSKIYIHANGLKDQPNFVKGSQFLMPWDLSLTVKTDRWTNGMMDILKTDRLPYREKRLDEDVVHGTHREKVKLFVGFEYECPSGHRFFTDKPQHILYHDRNDGILRTEASELVASNLPLYARCKCSKTVIVNAQLMRIHLVTPKAPVGVRLVPMVMLDSGGYFHMGQVAELSHSRYYVLRFPFAYESHGKLHKKPISSPSTCGTLLQNAIQVYAK
ncbi:unnamed protein product [Bursaphelenchus okinawaensis]|uniref:Nonsense-mediated mRNA decay factor SMG8 n=1 Tax=Bursaphelenchus okinawaensis TaxID=465554 RepID=A0A811L1Q7_9BILA|nr:unnamed protein product [Bursaphelenchus okinawaensis]CAG9114917.1 unnamed protein product [Bursaphelenchus okinawaensis]